MIHGMCIYLCIYLFFIYAYADTHTNGAMIWVWAQTPQKAGHVRWIWNQPCSEQDISGSTPGSFQPRLKNCGQIHDCDKETMKVETTNQWRVCFGCRYRFILVLDFVPGLEELCIAKFLVIHLNPTTTETGSQNLRQSDSHCHMVPPISPSHLSRITKEGLTDLRGLTSNWWVTGFHACGRPGKATSQILGWPLVSVAMMDWWESSTIMDINDDWWMMAFTRAQSMVNDDS